MEQLKQHWLSKIFAYIGTFLLIAFSFFALLYPQGNKFDFAKKIWLTYDFAGLAMGIFVLGIVVWLMDLRRIKNYELEIKNDGVAKPPFRDSRFQIPDSHRWPSLPVMFFLCGYIGWTVLSFFHSQTANFGYSEVLMACGVALLFATYRGLWKPKILYIFANLILVLSSVAGFWLYLTSHHQRAFGLFYDPAFKADAWPNAFALFVLLLWPLLFHALWKGNSVKSLLLRNIVVFSNVVGLSFVFATFVLTFSRAGLLCFVAQIFLIGMYGIVVFFKQRASANQNKSSIQTPSFTGGNAWKMMQCTLTVVLAVVLVLGGQYLRAHYFQKTTVSFEDKAKFANGEEVTSVKERLDFWKGGIALTLKQPFWGYGPMSFPFVYRSIQTDWLAISDHAHNIFIKISSESGIPAATFFLIFLLLISGKFLVNVVGARILFGTTVLAVAAGHPEKNSRTDERLDLDSEKRFMVFILFVAFSGALAHNLVDYNLNFATNFIVFWMLLLMIDYFSSVEKYPVAQSTLKGIAFALLGLFLFSMTGYLTLTQGLNDLARIELGRKNINDGISYLPIYEHSLFPKYALLEQANWAAQHGKNDLAVKYFQLHLQRNQWDAFGYSQLGNFYEKRKNFKAAYENYAKALELDPKNSWTYYLDTIRLLQILGKRPELLDLSPKIISEFDQYLPKVKQNIHYTAQNGNSKTAQDVLKILIKVDSKNRAKFREDFKVIEESVAKYGKTK